MIISDSGPLFSATNRREGALHRLAIERLERQRSEVIVPWPVYTEVDLLLRGRGHTTAAANLGRSLLRGDFRLEAPTGAELDTALDLLERYGDIGLDLPDAVVMAMTDARKGQAFTWDFRHFRAVVLRRGEHVPLLVNESEMP